MLSKRLLMAVLALVLVCCASLALLQLPLAIAPAPAYASQSVNAHYERFRLRHRCANVDYDSPWFQGTFDPLHLFRHTGISEQQVNSAAKLQHTVTISIKNGRAHLDDEMNEPIANTSSWLSFIPR